MTLVWPESEYLVNDQYRFVLCPIPKVASSSLKQWFLTTIGYRPEAPDWPARPHVFLTAWNRARWRALPGDYPLIAFVRDPMRRLVSAYLQKFVVRWDVGDSPALPVIRAVCEAAGRSVDYEAGISFREFVTFLSGVGAMRMDVHWRPQHLFFRHSRAEIIGKVEAFDRDLQTVCERLGIVRCDRFETLRLSYREELLLGAADMSAGALRRLERFPPWASFVDDEIADRVVQLYGDDYRQFDYSVPDPANVSQSRSDGIDVSPVSKRMAST